MNKISYSQLSMYSQCPMHWKLRYVDEISVSESNIHLVFGTAMHETIQHYLDVMYGESVKKANEIDLPALLQKEMINEFKKAEENDGKPPCTKEQLSEFFDDGIEILDFFRKKRGEYFFKNKWELIGCEVPIDMELKNNIRMVGYLDVVLRHKPTDSIKIIDLKTSTKGWNKWMKKDFDKTSQLLLYKQFYSKQYNHPIDRIDIEYLILKRKLWENVDFPQKRFQKFAPASGKVSMNKIGKKLNRFIDEAFANDGSYSADALHATPSKNACRFCEFNQTEYCKEGII
tara:strand:- start:48369 stop:49229 length:861 start_codon:yes stop_codon:yes gene_type:complete